MYHPKKSRAIEAIPLPHVSEPEGGLPEHVFDQLPLLLPRGHGHLVGFVVYWCKLPGQLHAVPWERLPRRVHFCR